MVGKLFAYTEKVICHFNKLKKAREISIFATFFVKKCYFGLYFTAEMNLEKR